MSARVPPYIAKHRRRLAREKFTRDYANYIATAIGCLFIGYLIGTVHL